MEAQVRIQNNKIQLRAPYACYERCKSIPGGLWNKNEKAWEYPATPATAKQVLDNFRGVTIKSDKLYSELLNQAKSIEAAGSIKTSEGLPPIPLVKTTPWLHQLRAYHYAYNLPACMLYMRMGTGKSKVIVDLVVNKNYEKVLILCPLKVAKVWPIQFERHDPTGLTHIEVLNKGSVAKKADRIQEVLDLQERKVIVVNYDSAWREPLGPIYDGVSGKVIHPGILLSEEWDMVVCDESHRIQSHNANISKFCAKLSELAAHRICLTGTPFSSGPLSVFGQYRFLDPGIFGRAFGKFEQHYAIKGGYGGYQVLGYQNKEELNKKFYGIAFYVSEDCLDLPAIQDVPMHFTLCEKAQRIYRELEEEFYSVLTEEIDEAAEEISASNSLVKLLRLQQLTSGYLPSDSGSVVEVDSEKKDLLREILADIDSEEPVVIFCQFVQDLANIEKVCTELNREHYEISGRKDEWDRWQKSGKGIIAAQIQAGSEGVDFTQSRYAIYYSVGYKLYNYEQSRARLRRPGQERPMTFYHLIAENTVDVKVYNALANKQEVIRQIYQEGKNEGKLPNLSGGSA